MKNCRFVFVIASFAAASSVVAVDIPFDWQMSVDGVVCHSDVQRPEVDDYASWTHHVVYQGLNSGGTSLPVRVFFEFEGSRGSYLKCSGWVENCGVTRMSVGLEGPVAAPWKVVRGRSRYYSPNGGGWRIRRFPTEADVAVSHVGKTLGQVWAVGSDGLVRCDGGDEPPGLPSMQYCALSDGEETWSYIVKDASFSPMRLLATYDPKSSELVVRFARRMILGPGERRDIPRIEVLKRKGDWQVAALDYGAWLGECARRPAVQGQLHDLPSFVACMNGIGCRFDAGEWLDAWPEMALLSDPGCASPVRLAIKNRDILMRGRFMDELGFKVATDAERFIAKRWSLDDGLSNVVLVWNADTSARTFAVSGCGVPVGAEDVEAGTVPLSAPLAGESARIYRLGVCTENVSVVGPEWRFTRRDDAQASVADYNDDSWEKVVLPHDWAIGGAFNASNDAVVTTCEQELQFDERVVTGRTGALPWLGTGWYRGSFDVPEGAGFAALKFEGAMSNARVWIDGRFVGERPYGYIPFSVPAPCVPGRHVVALRLENFGNSMRWYPGAGLYRHVRLITGPKLGLAADGTFVSTAQLAADGTARLSVVEHVRGDDRTRKPQDLTMSWKVKDEDGRELDIDFVDTSVSDGVANGTIEVRNPVVWSPESPRLVTLVSELRLMGDLIDRRETRFGIRTVRVAPEGLLLNGRPVEIRGAGLHADLGSIGPAFNASAFRRQLRLLRDMGCNAIRTAHNPPAPDAMSIADEEGFLVMAEAFDMWKTAKVKEGYAKDFPKWGERDFTDFITLYRNHPSIIMWSIGNEIWEADVRDTVAIGRKFIDIAHRLDPSRPVVQCSDRPADTHAGYFQQLDLPCLNYRVGWDPNEARFLPQMHRASKSGLVIISEGASIVSSRGVYKFPVKFRVADRLPTGVHADGVMHEDGQCSGYDIEPLLWGNPPDADFAVVEKYPWLIGQFAWHGFDYLGEPTPYKEFWPSRSCYYGCLDMGGIPKDRYYLYRAQWNRRSPTLHLLPHWTWPGREGEVTPVYCYTSYPSAELFVNGKSQGRRTKDPTSRLDRYRLRWNDVVYEPGMVKVVAYDMDGRMAAERIVCTAGAPKRVQVIPECGGDGGRDARYPYPRLVYCRVRIVDADGNLCPDADDSVTVSVSGGARLRALCNGDPTSLEPLTGPTMKVFHGELVATLEVVDAWMPASVLSEASGLVAGKAEVKQ